MKTERRHELQQNDLAMYLDRMNKSIEPYSRIIAVAIAVLVIVSVGFGFFRMQQRETRSDATLNLIQASASPDAEVLLEVSEKYPGTAAGAWARVYQGQRYLAQGIQSLYNDRDEATNLLGDAQAAFRFAISGSDDTLLRSRAFYGIALADESLGNVDEAIEAYQEVIAMNESDAMVKKAEERIAALSSPQSKAFLAWFADQDFAPADPSLPPSLPGSDALPGLPDLDLPELSLSSEDDTMEFKDLEGGLEMPKDGAKKDPGEEKDAASEKDASSPDQPAADKPEANAPASEEPASEEAASEEPASEEPASEEAAAESAPAKTSDADKKSDQDADSAADTKNDSAEQ